MISQISKLLFCSSFAESLVFCVVCCANHFCFLFRLAIVLVVSGRLFYFTFGHCIGCLRSIILFFVWPLYWLSPVDYFIFRLAIVLVVSGRLFYFSFGHCIGCLRSIILFFVWPLYWLSPVDCFIFRLAIVLVVSGDCFYFRLAIVLVVSGRLFYFSFGHCIGCLRSIVLFFVWPLYWLSPVDCFIFRLAIVLVVSGRFTTWYLQFF